jgi:predicted  nucleic acid-binding Zn-ribbon protein
MKIEATVKQIRALLELAALNDGADGLTAEARRGKEATQRGVPRLVLERYHSLIDTGRTPAVVAIERGTCTGCHIRLPTMLEYQAGRLVALYTCPHCRRMLYASQLVRQDRDDDDGKSRHAPAASGVRRS